MFFSIKHKQHGTTLIEVLIAIIILVMIMAGIFSLIRLSFKLIGRSEVRITASNLANEQMELLRNLPYDKLGTTAGWPKGDIPSSRVKTLNNINYTIKTNIQYIDDPLDGLAPADLYNADYKKARVWVFADKFPLPNPVVLVSNFAPKGIEAPAGGGTLSLSVIDAKTDAVSEVNVKILNVNLDPNINIETQTDANGKLIVPVLPQDLGNNYEIQATKDGLTSDYTSPSTEAMPNPILPHQTIIEGEVTSLTLTIDKVSSFKIKTNSGSFQEDWCGEKSNFRKQLSIKNEGEEEAANQTLVKYSLNHKELVTAEKSKENGDDIRIFYAKDNSCQELDRIAITSWNNDLPTEILFETQGEIAANTTDTDYYLYYDYPYAEAPPANLEPDTPSPLVITEGGEASYITTEPLGNIPLNIFGERILGLDQNNSGVLRNKFEDETTDLNGDLNLADIEWDNYTILPESPFYDLAEISSPNPVSLAPDQIIEISLILFPHNLNTFHLTVKDSGKNPISDAKIKITKNGFEKIKVSSSAGQAFFSPLDPGTFTLEVNKPGYITSSEEINISGNVEKEVILSASS